MDKNQKEYTGTWIPREIMLDERLKPQDRILYAEIACFSDGCYQRSEILMKRCGVKKKAFGESCKRLVIYGYISQQRKFGRIFRKSLLGFGSEKISMPKRHQTPKGAVHQTPKGAVHQTPKGAVHIENKKNTKEYRKDSFFSSKKDKQGYDKPESKLVSEKYSNEYLLENLYTDDFPFIG